MFGKSKDEMKKVNTMTQNSAPTSRPAANATPSIIGADVTITGNIKTGGEVQLEGAVDGDITCGNLVMGESGSVRGTIKADVATIRGAVKGKVSARTVRLEATAVIEGDVMHETLSVEAGAKITGQFANTTQSAKPAMSAAPKAVDSKPDVKPATGTDGKSML